MFSKSQYGIRINMILCKIQYSFLIISCALVNSNDFLPNGFSGPFPTITYICTECGYLMLFKEVTINLNELDKPK